MYLNLNLRLIWVVRVYIKNLNPLSLILFLFLLVGVFQFTKFNGDDSRTTWEHVSQYILQLGEAGFNDALRVRLFSLSLTGTAFSWFSSLAPNSI